MSPLTNQNEYLLLPSDRELIEYLKRNHNIDLSEDDFREISIQQFKTQQSWEHRLATDSAAIYYVEVEDGKVLAVVAFAVVGFFAAPFLGIGALTGALLGASIGFRLFGGGDKKDASKQQRGKDRGSTQTFGFNSAPSVTPVGGVAPLVFTNRSLNPNGGVRTSGVVLFSNVRTWGGIQTLYTIYGIGVGELGFVDESKTLINGQPRTNFFQDEIKTTTRSGTDAQSFIDGFTYYSQCISVSNNNQLGISKKGKASGSVSNSTTISVSADDIDNFIPSDNYSSSGEEFRIISKNNINNTLQTNRAISLPNNSEIFALYKITYTTSKKCTEVQLNFVANLTARNSNNDLQQHGILFTILVDGVFVGRFIFAAKTESDIRRQIKIKNLPITKHKIECVVNNGTNNADGVYYCSDVRQAIEVNSGGWIGGKQVFIEYEQSQGVSLNVSQINSVVNTNKAQTSNDRGAIVQLTTVNEIVYPSDLGHQYRSNHKGIAIVSLIADASNRLQSDPAPSWFIERGIVGRQHLSSGKSNNNSTSTQLNDLTANFNNDSIQPNLSIIRNLDKGNEAIITSFTNNTVTTTQQLYWQLGDRYLIYNDKQSLCRFPDIYVWTLISKRGGLGMLLPGTQIADYFIDYDTIVRSRKWCIQNNFFWDDAISGIVNWQEWVSTESMSSLLFPTRFGGKFGLIPEGNKQPSALFNASNILPDTYSEEYAPEQKLNCVHMTYTDNSDDVPKEKTVTIMTSNAYYGNEVLYPESLKFESINNESQAIKVAQVYLKSRLLQDRVIRFDTALQGYFVREGDFIIVQHITTEVEKESSGFVLESISYVGGTQKVILSAPTAIGLNNQYSAAIYRLETGTLQNNLVCYGKREGNPAQNIIEIQGLSSELKVARDGYTGDYVIIGKDTEKRRTYRVQQIEPKENGSVTITAVLWTSNILNSDGLVTVN